MYKEKIPNATLSLYANKLYYLRSQLPYKKEKILPMPVIHFILNLGDPYKLYLDPESIRYRWVKGCFISGINEHPITIDNPLISHNIGIEFKPYGFYPFSPLSMASLKNDIVDVDTLFPDIEEVLSRIKKEKEISPKFTILEKYLNMLINKKKSNVATIEKIINVIEKNPDISLNELSLLIGYSSKHIISIVKQYTGHTPKSLSMLYKFQRFIDLFSSMKEKKWVTLASEFDYYDQADFVKKFKQYTGVTPSQYKKQLLVHDSGDANFTALDIR